MKLRISKKNKLKGKIKVPGDKSISHRSIIINSLAKGKSVIKGFLESEDCLHTLNAFRQMGVEIEKKEAGNYIINGNGLNNLHEPDKIINCGNSGTSMRLLSGVLSGQNFYAVLNGDDSLRNRPMKRIIEPLRKMGADIWGRDKNNKAPLSINGKNLSGINYNLPVASAQVKSAILLAGLYTKEELIIKEPGVSRDHTERFLLNCGINININNRTIKLKKGKKILNPLDMQIPGDISSASFFIAAGLIIPDSEILIKDIGVNPTRSGIIDLIKKMNGKIELLNYRNNNGEPIADILVRHSKLKANTIEKDIIPRLIDEIPIISIIASQAEGKTIIKDAEELRVKETDRIKAIVCELKKMGVNIEERKDGLIINGPSKLKGGVKINTYGDHRIAMSFIIAALIANGETIIKNTSCINTSFPGFMKIINSL